MIKFKNTKFEFKEPLAPNSNNNKAEWIFTGNVDAIEDIQTTCGCTSYKVEKNKIVAFFNAPSEGNFEKSIIIWIKSDEPLNKINENGVMVRNQDHPHIRLDLSGTIA